MRDADDAGRRVGPIHHVAVVVRSIDEALPRYRALFGLERDGAVELVESQEVRVCFVRTGAPPAARIELVEPLNPENGVGRFLASRGEGLHHVCFEAQDVATELERLAARGAELVDERRRTGASGPTVALVHPRTFNGVLWELRSGSEADG